VFRAPAAPDYCFDASGASRRTIALATIQSCGVMPDRVGRGRVLGRPSDRAGLLRRCIKAITPTDAGARPLAVESDRRDAAAVAVGTGDRSRGVNCACRLQSGVERDPEHALARTIVAT
jgi:hypothetical protein